MGQQAGIFKIRKSLGEIEGRNREIERHINIETKLTIKMPSKASKLISYYIILFMLYQTNLPLSPFIVLSLFVHNTVVTLIPTFCKSLNYLFCRERTDDTIKTVKSKTDQEEKVQQKNLIRE